MFTQLAGLKMRDIVTHSVAGHPEIVFAEYEGDAPTPGGNSYTQIYTNKLEFRDGRRPPLPAPRQHPHRHRQTGRT